jgi:hypothetical protein
MGKTIALKLSKKEEQVITQFNEKGMTNSQLLRSALRHYVQNIPEFSSDNAEMKTIFIKQENIQTDFLDSVKELKLEMQALQEQFEKTQRQVESEMKALQRQLGLLTVIVPSPDKCVSSMNIDIAGDIHQQVDEFLYKQSKRND